MIIERVNITAILGTPFSTNFTIEQISEALTQAMPNIKEKYPSLHEVLSIKLKTVNDLQSQQATIQQQGEVVRDLQIKIKQADKLLKKVVVAYEKSNQIIVGKIGAAPTGGPPTYPTAAIESTPTINAVTQAHLSLQQLESELENQSNQLVSLSTSYKEQVEQIGTDIASEVGKVQSSKYNTQVEQYIYT